MVAVYYVKFRSERRRSSLPQVRLLRVYEELFRALVRALLSSLPIPLEVACDRFEGCETLLPALQTIIAERMNDGTVEF